MVKVLVINSGSSSIKYQLIAMPSEQVICAGMVERIGSKEAEFTFRTSTTEIKNVEKIKNHKAGLQMIADALLNASHDRVKNTAEIQIVAHRVVHGGNAFSETTGITKTVKDKIKELSTLAPLHNPHNLEGIVLSEQLFSGAEQIAVFDTAFHQSIPMKAKKYAIPNAFYAENEVQVYGFHGTSHKYVAERAIDYLQKKNTKIITIHLGNGCSMTAVRDGKSIDHSLGFTPSNGLIMGSRSGDIDHSIIFYLVNTLGYDLKEVNDLLIRKSGMLGLTGYSDLRDIQTAAGRGNKDCILALEMSAYRIKKFIGSYAAAMNGLDALVFTAGIGENSSLVRKMACAELDFLDIVLDEVKNEMKTNSSREISSSSSKVKILVIPTNEELEIAKQAYALVLQKD